LRIQFWRPRRDAGPEKGTPTDEQPTTLEAKLDAMKDRFLGRVRAEYAILSLYRQGSLPATPELIFIVHKLAGSAGMVGYSEISEAAGRLDDELADANADNSARLQELLIAMEKAISAKDTALSA